MKNISKTFGIVAVLVVLLLLGSCTTMTSIGGTTDPQGLIAFTAADAATEGATEIASYMVIMGLVTTGYDEYAAAVRQAVAAGRQVSSVTTWYFIFSRTTAFAR